VPELRKDPVTGQWVIIGTERPRRPEDFRAVVEPRQDGASCAFCEGNERETPPEVLAYRPSGDGAPNTPGWRVRVVPNQFPALRVEGDLEPRGHGLYDLMNGVGAHELVVESPRHEQSLATLPLVAVEDVVHAYQERMLDLRRDARFRAVVVFKSADRGIGPSLGHPYSQLLATPTLPLDLMAELTQARTYYDYRERCLFCDILHQETAEGDRIVAESEHVLAFVPFAARTPFATWLAPRRHAAGYEHVRAGERRDLARTLRAVLARLRRLLGGAPFSLVLHSAPFAESDAPYFHWHVEIAPRVVVPGVLAAGSAFPVNPLPPEDAARFLRAVHG
jgi:UDPglucose--hexose-1-phosphate uridylyltransferase